MDDMRLASAIPVPLEDGLPVRAFVTEAEIDGAWRWSVVFGLDHGRRDSLPVQLFDSAAEARALCKVLNETGTTSTGSGTTSTAPDSWYVPVSSAPVGRPCVVCGAALPLQAHRQRLTCSEKCKKARQRLPVTR
jgi:hypothetical protein